MKVTLPLEIEQLIRRMAKEMEDLEHFWRFWDILMCNLLVSYT